MTDWPARKLANCTAAGRPVGRLAGRPAVQASDWRAASWQRLPKLLVMATCTSEPFGQLCGRPARTFASWRSGWVANQLIVW